MTDAVSDLFSLEGKVALVTGASGTLGQSFVRTLTAAGASVAAAGRRSEPLLALAGSCAGVVPITGDLSHEDGPEHVVARVRAEVGPVDVLVNNAGIVGGVVRAQDESRESFDQVLAVNLTAPARLSAAVHQDMVARGGGSIVNISSISGVVGLGRIPQASYVASKTGLIGLTRELALQWASKNIRVNAIAAGFFESEMTEGLYASERMSEWLESNTPLRRRGAARDMSGALLLLASDAGRYITGQTVTVDGGWTAR
ncbi:3-oxoacyl-[acyl-carrier-protein] reductase [Nocardioides hungaricus]